MLTYIARRVGTSIIVVVGVSIAIFILLHVIYPSPARDVLGLHASVAEVNLWDSQHGYDDPVIVQYWHYVDQLLHGNLGYSYAENQTVAALFAERLARSIYLSGISLVLAIAIAVPLGIYQAVKRNTIGDNIADQPGLRDLLDAGLLPRADPDRGLRAVLAHPRVRGQPVDVGARRCWGTGTNGAADGHPGPWSRSPATRATCGRPPWTSSPRTTSRWPGPRACRSGSCCCRHLVRNASLPMVTLIGLSIPLLLAGNLITETLFNFQGLGLLFFNSLQNGGLPDPARPTR